LIYKKHFINLTLVLEMISQILKMLEAVPMREG